MEMKELIKKIAELPRLAKKYIVIASISIVNMLLFIVSCYVAMTKFSAEGSCTDTILLNFMGALGIGTFGATGVIIVIWACTNVWEDFLEQYFH